MIETMKKPTATMAKDSRHVKPMARMLLANCHVAALLQFSIASCMPGLVTYLKASEIQYAIKLTGPHLYSLIRPFYWNKLYRMHTSVHVSAQDPNLCSSTERFLRRMQTSVVRLGDADA